MRKSYSKYWDNYTMIPTGTPPLYMLSLDNWPTYRAGLKFYYALTLQNKLKKKIMYRGYGPLRLARSIGWRRHIVADKLLPLKAFLVTFDRGMQKSNIYVPSFNKAVVQLVNSKGNCERIIKVALSEDGMREIQDEITNIELLKDSYFRSFEIPAVNGRGYREGLFYVEYASDGNHEPFESLDCNEIVGTILSELFEARGCVTNIKLTESLPFRNIEKRVKQLEDENAGKMYEQVINRYNNMYDVEVPLGLVHYDFKPWNMLKNMENGKILLVDWEMMTQRGLPLWDAYSYILFTYLTIHCNASPKKAYSYFAHRYGFLKDYASRIGINDELIKTLLPLYLVDICTINELWGKWEESEKRPTRTRSCLNKLLEFIVRADSNRPT